MAFVSSNVLSPERILIIRTSAIGDIVFASPFASALKRTYPQAQVSWLVQSGYEPLLEANPYLYEVISWPKQQWQSEWKQRNYCHLWKSIRQFCGDLKKRQFDWAIDLQGLMKSGMLAKISGAPRRTGLGSKEGSQWLMNQIIAKGGDIQRISSEYLFAANELGLETGDFLPEIYISESTIKTTKQLLIQHGLQPGRYAVIAPFTTRPQKHWENQAWRELMQSLYHRYDISSLVLGGKNDQDVAQELVNGVSGAISLAGKTPLNQSAALVNMAGLLVGVDTGIAHIAIALKTPAVMLFGSTCPYLQTGRDNVRVIWLGLSCAPCGRRPTCNGAYSCMREITVAKVLGEIVKVAPALTQTEYISLRPT